METRSGRLIEEARVREIRLIDALRSGGEEEGVIGRFAGQNLQRLPSSIYWSGLRSWGIRRFLGSQDSYLASLTARNRRQRVRFSDEALAEERGVNLAWSPELPPRPDDLLERADFQLTGDEAGFLMDRLVDAQPDSLLTHLVKTKCYADCDYVWEHPEYVSFPSAARRLIGHAEMFSAVMRGAALTYNLMLAEKRENEQWIDRYRRELSNWKTVEFCSAALADWSLDDFWNCIAHENHQIRHRTLRFVRNWRELVKESRGEVADLNAARELVSDRERSLKGTHSRFVNRTVLDRWGGRSGANRLNFRWLEGNSHIWDLVHAE